MYNSHTFFLVNVVGMVCIRVVRPSSSFKMSESNSNSKRSYDSDDSEYNLSLATSTLAILKSKTMEI